MAVSLTESAAFFKERCNVAGLAPETVQILEGKSINTLSKLAFACGQLGELPAKGLRRTPAGELPMDSVLPSLESDPKVVFHLLPLPCKSTNPSSSTRKLTDEAPDPPPSKWQKTGKGKKGKGKQKFGKPPKSMPVELKGKWSTAKRGVPLCWPYNTSEGCPDAPNGGRCDRGTRKVAFPSRRLEELFCVEIFAGSGRLTCELRKVGLGDSVGVDHHWKSRQSNPNCIAFTCTRLLPAGRPVEPGPKCS